MYAEKRKVGNETLESVNKIMRPDVEALLEESSRLAKQGKEEMILEVKTVLGVADDMVFKRENSKQGNDNPRKG